MLPGKSTITDKFDEFKRVRINIDGAQRSDCPKEMIIQENKKCPQNHFRKQKTKVTGGGWG